MTRSVGHLTLLILPIMLAAADDRADYATPEFKQRVSQAFLADRLTEVRDAFTEIIDRNPSWTHKTTAYLALVDLRLHHRPRLDLPRLPEFRKQIEAHRADLSRELQYTLDRSVVQLLQADGNYRQAADAATAMRIVWEKSQLKTLMIHADEVRLLCLAGRRDQAERLVAEAWLNFPNDFHRNAAVRSQLASYLNDQHLYGPAYELLYQLLGSFRQELVAQPYLVQNLVEYAANSFVVGASQEQTRQRLEIIDLGVEVAANPGSESIRSGLYFSMGKIAHLLCDADRAISYYRLAAKAAGPGEFDRNIAQWSNNNITRLENRDFSDLKGKDFTRPAKDPWIAKAAPTVIKPIEPSPVVPRASPAPAAPKAPDATPMPTVPIQVAPPAKVADPSGWRFLAILCGAVFLLSAGTWLVRRFRR